MEKTATSTTLAPRKRKQRSFFPPLSSTEEKEITRALQVSLKKTISEDEDEDEDEDYKEVEPSDLETSTTNKQFK